MATFLTRAAVLSSTVLLLASPSVKAQLFQQDFSSSTTVANYASGTPSNGQWNALTTSGPGVVISINTAGSNKLRYARTGNAAIFSRTSDFSPAPSTLMYRFDLALSGNSAATTTAALLQVGSGFGVGNTAEAGANVHTRIGMNITATAGEFQMRDVAGSANSSSFAGTQTVLWVVNNSGASSSYRAPDGTEETLADDRFDLWVGTTKVFNDGNPQTGTQTLTDFKMVFNNGVGTFDFDNFLIDPVPAQGSALAATAPGPFSFTANWNALAGVTGYSLDVSTSPSFASFVSGYNNLYISGAGTTSQAVSGLDPLTTYYYRVRGTSSYTVGSFSGANSGAITANTTAVPVYYSRATGNVNDPIWSDTPSGTAGPATWTNASDMVVQSGDAVTVDANTTIKSLTVDNGGTLSIDANRWIKATAGTNTISGALNAADDSEFRITEGTSATLALGGTVSFWDFTMGMTAGITVTGTMEVRGTLQLNDGVFDCSGATVVLNSTATETGRLGPVAPTASYNGNLRIERYRPAGLTNWMLLGSPIQSRTVNHWQDDFITAGYPGSQFPNFDDPVGSNILWPSIRWYDETAMSPNANDGLVGVASNSQALTTGQGFAVWAGSGLVNTAAFEVDLQNNAPVIASTPITLPMSYTNSGNPSVDGWNLVSNPLPSPIAFDQIVRGADVGDFVTFYNPANGNTAVWDISLGFGTNGGTNTIQSMQGFFLKASGGLVTTTVAESAKVNDNAGGMFGLTGEPAAHLRLRIASDLNAFSDEAIMVFSEGLPSVDADDAEKFVLAHGAAPQIATLSDGIQLAINAYGSADAGASLPLRVHVGVTGEHTISAVELGGLELACLAIEDLETGAMVSLLGGTGYTFTMDAAADPEITRFVLHINNGPVASFTADNNTVAVGQPVQFTAAGTTGSYAWSFGDGTQSTDQNPQHAYAAAGTYTVTLTADDGVCSDSASDEVVVELSTSVASGAKAEHRAWATPQGIVVEHAFTGKAAVTVELLDATGRVAYTGRMNAIRQALPSAQLASGAWFVRLDNGSERVTLRVPLAR